MCSLLGTLLSRPIHFLYHTCLVLRLAGNPDSRAVTLWATPSTCLQSETWQAVVGQKCWLQTQRNFSVLNSYSAVVFGCE